MEKSLVAIAIFLVAYVLIISEKIHRTVIALAGAILLILFQVISQETAFHHIDFNTIGLLTGMMLLVGIVSQTGLFTYLSIWSAKKVNAEPIKILVVIGILTAVASALLDNVTTVLLVVPVVFSITKLLEISPMPYLFTVILTSNIGGTATLIGDPPNIMIGSAVKELTFAAFVNNLAAISLFILAITLVLLVFFYRKGLVTTEELKAKMMALDERKQIKDILLLKKSLFVLFLTIAGFSVHQVLHLESATVALSGALLLLLMTYANSEHELERIFHKVEWLTIFFFVGLFVLVSGLIETGVISLLAKDMLQLTAGKPVATAMVILWLSALASAFVDNIPFVATMIPMIKEMGIMGVTNIETLWWSLALGACLGGNGTLIGASANVIVAGLAAQNGYTISFMKYFKVAFPLMLLSIVISSVYIYVRYLL
ncbi:Na(+)/H(+) antiporter NhaD [Sporomusa ovata DSM 2662]|uniref:Na+/H+ antiporter NhaD type n=1 Tax=Sporomusa ovata TaxID=2378 RepID=A0A0U1KXH5_9FIRM|nr:ArsB/NhaD family transporter [Sporomusa ovata]EQB28275.1 putative tyrosine transporter P-protein [Sporomusa ovata DSM 2662]CQR71819.1 Na+/H+ antiporter NhaD type [Sporomusa ovata]